MKTLILYCSQCGSTKKYAEDIAKFVDGDILPLKKAKKRSFKDYDTIVFGGWVDNGEIKGLNDFLSFWNEIEKKNVIVFSTGITFPNPEGRKILIESNFLDSYHLRFYQLRGSFNVSKLKFPYSLIVKMVIKKVMNNPNASLEQKQFVELKNNPVEFYDYEGIEKIESVLTKLGAIKE